MACPEASLPPGAGSLSANIPARPARLPLLALTLGLLGAAPVAAQTSQQQYVYASNPSSSNPPASTISGFVKNSLTGALTNAPGSPYAQRIGGHALAIDPLRRFLYVLNPGANDVSVFAIDQSTGALSEVTGSPFSAADGVTPQVLAAEASGKFLYVGNVHGTDPTLANNGILDIYSIQATTGVLTHVLNPVIGPYDPTAMVTDAKGRFLYTNGGPNGQTGDPGTASVGYQIDSVTGALSTGGGCGSGVRGRSLAIDPKGRFLFVGNGQLQGFIGACAISPLDGSGQLNGTFTLGVSTFPQAMAVDSSGSYLYVSQTLNVVRAFAIDQTTGVLSELPNSPLQGIQLGGIVADPQGPYLYATSGNDVVGLQVDLSTGALTQITSVATGGSAAVAVSGTPVQPVSGPVATVIPAVLDFGNVLLGTTSGTLIVHVANTGGQTLGFSGISIMGANTGDFSQTNTCTAPLAPNQNCAISVNFTPSAAGMRMATLAISDSAPGSPQSVPLTGAA